MLCFSAYLVLQHTLQIMGGLFQDS
jgi:hypothetical protein